MDNTKRDNMQIKRSNCELIKEKVIFNQSSNDVIAKIMDRKDDVIIEEAEIVQSGDYILVKGYLNKSIVYNTINKGVLNKLKNNKKIQVHDYCDDKKDKREDRCESVKQELESIDIDGVVKHTTLWIPFKILINAPNARRGDIVVIENTEIKPLYMEDEIIKDNLLMGVLVNDVVTISIAVKKYH